MCSYSSMDGVLYCKTHFEQLFKETGSFSKKFTPGNIYNARLSDFVTQVHALCIKARPERFVA